MRIIVFHPKNNSVHQIWLGGVTFYCILFSVITLLVVLCSTLGYQAGKQSAMSPNVINQWRSKILEQTEALEKIKSESEAKFQILIAKTAEMKARMTRLDAAGERLIDIAGLDSEEFQFKNPPAMGGPETPLSSEHVIQDDLNTMMSNLLDTIETRQTQLDTLQSVLITKKIEKETYLSGRPIESGWLSSEFGRRNDPFTGDLAWHNGIDFAGKEGSKIVAVAAGIVVESGKNGGYGTVIEIDHGGGYKTRYAHNKENVVKTGDIVSKGQTIALMGSSGRSTGPHVHFEVVKNGRLVNPANYVNRSDLQ